MPMKRRVIAVIDDNLGVLSALSRVLSVFGYATELYASAQEFLDAAMMSEAMCLIIDIHIANHCGIELARRLADQGFSTPIIFMSADRNDSIKSRAMETGCVAFLTKPFGSEVLIKALDSLPSRRLV
jgi:FixJ family two-component response regulator